MDPQERILSRYNWKKVEAPQTWKPEEVGEKLVGYYGGRTLRDGPHGQYEVLIVHVPGQGAKLLSGTRIIQLLDSSMANIGDPLCIEWKGIKETGNGYQMKNYDLMVAEGEALDADHLPDVKGVSIRATVS